LTFKEIIQVIDAIVTFFIATVWVAVKFAKLAGMAFRVVTKLIRSRKAASASVASSGQSAKMAAPAKASSATAQAFAAATRISNGATERSGERRFEVADRNYLVHFGQGWSVTVRVYGRLGVAERTLRCTDAKMIEPLKHTYLKTVFPMSSVSLGEHSIEAVLRDCEVSGPALAAELLGRLGVPQLEPLPAVDAQRAKVVDASSGALPCEMVGEVEATQQAVANEAPDARRAQQGAKRTFAGKGSQVQGKVVEAGKRPSLSGSGSNFEVILETEEGAQEVKRGWHLSELFDKLKIEVGDKVVITDLGRKPLEPGADGQRRLKNFYEVQRVQEA
jgi:hypothetical protein